MEYSLRACLEDKSLRGTLADAPFGFADGNGVFDLDFQEQSIRKNHRKTFDRLMKLGGEELLQKLLEEGKTCLMGEKGKGTSAIAGTDRFHLKTNAGAPTALSSIFHGIAGWAEVSEDFDLDLVTCTLEEEESEEDDDLPDGEPETESWEMVARWGNPLPPQTCSLITRNGAPCFFDEENKEFISLPGTDGPVTELAACEPLIGKVSSWSEDEEIMGYRYRTEPDGKWGYVSRLFTQIVPPQFDEILVARYGDAESCIFAWSKDESFEWNTQFQIVCSVKAPYDQQEIWLDLNGAFTVKGRDLLPQKDGWREYSLDQKFLLYRPSAEAKKGLLLHPPFFVEQWDVTFLPDFLALENNFGPDCIRWVAIDFEGPSPWLVDTCRKAASAPPPDFTVQKCLRDRIALIEKEGYWAVARLSNDSETGKLQVARWLTPLAFTHIEVVDENLSFLLVDQFGQLGIFNWNTEKYVVPCRYDRVQWQSSSSLFGTYGYFQVQHGGFVGTIDTDGSWKEHLHREEQA